MSGPFAVLISGKFTFRDRHHNGYGGRNTTIIITLCKSWDHFIVYYLLAGGIRKDTFQTVTCLYFCFTLLVRIFRFNKNYHTVIFTFLPYPPFLSKSLCEIALIIAIQ